MKIGIIGCGAIGSVLCRYVDKKKDLKLAAICDIDKAKTGKIKNLLKSKPVITNIDNLIKKTDLIIEAVSPKVVKDILLKCIKYKKDLMVMSVGGLLKDMNLLKKITNKLYIPSGAICGIDGLKAANIENIKKVTITSIKSPRSLEGAPYIIKKKIDLKKIKHKKTIFDGNAIDAIIGFPSNVNVSATLSLAGIGPKKTRVKVIVDPNTKKNTHIIEITGSFGKLKTITENVVSPLNPKTSHMAVLSACATLERLTGHIKIGN
ncbi:MAG: aspartate dehydrogenase domain-containing protein [Nanoarchaeota archaeon]